MKIRYVQLESHAFLMDLDFLAMTPAERGVYCTLILHLYCKGGKCKLDPAVLGKLCNCRNFEKMWEKIAKHFQTRKGVIRHKRVTLELDKAREFSQARRESGLKGAQKRWGRHSEPNGPRNDEPVGEAMAKKRKGNEKETESEVTTNTNTSSCEQALSSSSSVRPDRGLPADPGPAPAGEAVRTDPLGDRLEQIAAIARRLGIRADKALGRTEDSEGEIAHQAVDQSRGLHFHQALAGIIRPRTRSDRTCFRNVANWLMRRIAEGRFTEEIFARVLDLADEAKSARNPAAAFMALLKKELRYPNG